MLAASSKIGTCSVVSPNFDVPCARIAPLTLPPTLQVSDCGVVSVLVGHVLHLLGPTVRQQYVVLAQSHLSLPRFLVTESRPRLFGVDLVLELVVGWLLKSTHFDNIKRKLLKLKISTF